MMAEAVRPSSNRGVGGAMGFRFRAAVAGLTLAAGCVCFQSVAAAAGRKFKGVWYRTEERGKFAVFLASGDLTVGPEVLSFDSKKRPFTIPTSSIRRVHMAKFDDSPGYKWMVVEYADQGGARIAAFRDGAFGKDSDAILASVQSIAPSPSPANVVANPEPDFIMPGEPGALSTYRGHAQQFTIDVPSGWFVRDQSDVRGSAGTRGVIAFAAESFNVRGGSVEDVMKAALRHDTGEVPMFFVDRHPNGPGMSCETYTKSAEATVVTSFQSAASLGKGTTVSKPARVGVVRIGDCFGLKVRLHARESDGHPLSMLVYTVSDGTTRFDFTLRNHDEFFEKNLPAFEKSIQTVKLASRSGAETGH